MLFRLCSARKVWGHAVIYGSARRWTYGKYIGILRYGVALIRSESASRLSRRGVLLRKVASRQHGRERERELPLVKKSRCLLRSDLRSRCRIQRRRNPSGSLATDDRSKHNNKNNIRCLRISIDCFMLSLRATTTKHVVLSRPVPTSTAPPRSSPDAHLSC